MPVSGVSSLKPSTMLSALGMRGLTNLQTPSTSTKSTTAPSVPDSSTAKNDKTMQLLLAAGLVGGGAFGLGRIMQRRPEKSEDEVNLDKLATDLRDFAVREVNNTLTKLASTLAPCDQAPVRMLQGYLSAGASVRLAVKTAFPHMKPEIRGIFARELVKKAVFAKKVGPQSGLSKQLDVKMFDTNETKTAMDPETVLASGALGATGGYVGRELGGLIGWHKGINRALDNHQNIVQPYQGVAGQSKKLMDSRNVAWQRFQDAVTKDRTPARFRRIGGRLGGLAGALAGLGIPLGVSYLTKQSSVRRKQAYTDPAVEAALTGGGSLAAGLGGGYLGYRIGAGRGQAQDHAAAKAKLQQRIANYNQQWQNWVNGPKKRSLEATNRSLDTLTAGHNHARRQYHNQLRKYGPRQELLGRRGGLWGMSLGLGMAAAPTVANLLGLLNR